MGLPLSQNLLHAANDATYFLDSLRYERFDDGGALRQSSLQTYAETADKTARVNAYIADTYDGDVLVDRFARRDSTYDADGRYTVTYFELDTLTGDWVGNYTATYSSHPDSGDHVVSNEPFDGDPNRSISSTHVTFDTVAGVFAYDLSRRTSRIFFPSQSWDTLYFNESFDELESDRERLFFFGSRFREFRDAPWANSFFGAGHYTGERSSGSYFRADTNYTALSPDSVAGTGFYEVRQGSTADRTRVDTITSLAVSSGTRYERLSYLSLESRGLTVRDSTVGREITVAGDTTAFTTVDELAWLPDAERLVEWTSTEIVDGERVPRFRYRFYYSRTGTSPAADVRSDVATCAGLRVATLPGARGVALDLPADITVARARVLDLAGRPVAETQLRGPGAHVSLPAALAPGLYAVEVAHARGRCARLVAVR